MPGKRRVYGAPFKAKVALAAAKGDRTTAQLASQFGIHTSQVTAWKKQLMAQVTELFADGAAADAADWADPQCAHVTRALETPKSAHNPAQQGAELGGMERQSEKPEPRNSRKKPRSLRQTGEWKTNRVGATGFEPATSTSRT